MNVFEPGRPRLLLMCECLIDQGRYIGNDPVGHACSNDADFEHVGGFMICRTCLALTKSAPERVTFPSYPLGREGQLAMVRQMCDQLLRVKR